MAATMNFFRAQDEARGRTTKLVVLLVVAILVLTGSLYVIAVMLSDFRMASGGYRGRSASFVYDGSHREWFQPKLFFLTTGLALTVIIGGSLLRIVELAKGGGAVALSLGGRLVGGATQDQAERRYLNIVQEMAIAAGLPVPLCFVLDGDDSINAFAAGNTPQDAAVGITRGALMNLTRDELQGVIAHEFSHIGNGDMRLSLRIIGAVAGLTALAQLGYLLIRFGFTSSSDNKKGAWPLGLVGLVVVIIGLGGVFFAKIIQASVSRQREYLADASAVQFTRNPLGLASALKKIAGFTGARRDASASQLEAQHLFFASSGGFLEILFSTHPPINERIRRIDPAFDGIIPDVAPVEGSEPAETPVAGIAPRQRMAPPPLPGAARTIPTDLQIQESVGFHGQIPMELRLASDDTVSAMGLVLGLVLRRDPLLRANQLRQAAGLAGGEVAREAERFEGLLRSLPAGTRVPLLDLSMPALRQLSSEQQAAFRLALDKVGYDADDGLIVLLIQASMRRYLSREAQPASRVGDLPAACQLVLSAVVRTSSEDESAQARAYELGAGVLGLPGLGASLLPSEQLDLQQVDDAIAVIAGQSVYDRRKFVRSCGAAMLNDGRAEPAEIEIVRAVADSLGISFATGMKA